MSRAEKKLAKLKAQEELKRLKAEKRERQQQEWKKTQEQWAALPNGTKKIFKIVGAVIVLFILVGAFTPSDESGSPGSTEATTPVQASEKKDAKPKTEQELMFENITGLMNSKDAFDTGSYVKGEVPAGEYAFIPFEGSGQYYSEEDQAGNIIDNENFDSFGYVYVNEAGNLQTRGVLVKVAAFKKLTVDSAREIYEKLNDVKDYKDSAMYKVGVDIAPGTYTIESYGEGYVEVMSGPVGNSDIVDNEIFKGKYSVTVQAGQYLKVSRGKLL